MFDQKLLRAPLNNAVMSQRVLKRSVARQASQVMAFLVLAKKCNAANERFRARPTGLSGSLALGVRTA